MSDARLRDRPVRPASSDRRRWPYRQGSAAQESRASVLPCGAQGQYLLIVRLAGAWRHRPTESRSVWSGHVSNVVLCGDHAEFERCCDLRSWQGMLVRRLRCMRRWPQIDPQIYSTYLLILASHEGRPTDVFPGRLDAIEIPE